MIARLIISCALLIQILITWSHKNCLKNYWAKIIHGSSETLKLTLMKE